MFARNKTAVFFFWFLVVLFFWQIFSAYNTLPARVPAHFNFWGKPDRWTSRESFIVMECLLVGLVVVGIYFLPIFFKKFPTNLINVPNKNYWFAPERKEKTLLEIETYFLWFGNGTLLFFFVLFQEIIFFAKNPHHSIFLWPEILLYLIFVLVWTFAFVRHFSKIP